MGALCEGNVQEHAPHGRYTFELCLGETSRLSTLMYAGIRVIAFPPFPLSPGRLAC